MKTKKIARYITIATLFLVPIFPLIVTNSFIFPFVTGKAFFFRILVEVAFAGWVILALLDSKYRPKVTVLNVCVTIFAIIVFVSDLFGAEPLRSLWSNFERMEGWITIIHLWAFYMIITNVFGNDENGKLLWRKWMNLSLIIATIVAIYGLFQLFGWVNFHKDLGRLDASFGNAEFLAVYLIFSAFISLYLFASKKRDTETKKKIDGKRSFRWVYILLVLLFSFVTFETQTRGAILGLAGGLILALVFYALFRKNESNRLRWITGGIVALLLVAGVLFWLNRDASFIQKNATLSRFASVSLSDASSQSRLYIWPMALNGALQKPILGWGQENFNYVFQSGYNPSMYNLEPWFDRAHNVFLDWLVSAGMLGLLSYLVLYVLFIIYVWKSSLGIAEKSILTGLLAAYTVNNLFVFDNLGSYIPFFAMLAYVNVMRDGRPVKWLGVNPLREEIVNYVALPVLVVLLVITVYFCSVRQIVVGREVVNAAASCGNSSVNIDAFRSAVDSHVYMAEQEAREQLYSCVAGSYWDSSLPRAKKQELVDLEKKAVAEQIRRTPDDSRSYYLAGLSLNEVGQIGAAEPLLEKAYELSPARQIFGFELAADLIYMKKFDQASAILKNAYESAPKYVQAAKADAIMLQLTGNETQARGILPEDLLFNSTLNTVKTLATNGEFNKLFTLFKGVTFTSDDANLVIAQAQMEYTQGMAQQAIQTLLFLEGMHPELKPGIDGMIKQMAK